MNKINIKTHSNNVFIDTPCVLCGELFDPDDTIHSLYHNDDQLGDICLCCVEDTENGKTYRIDRHVQSLNEHASWLCQIKTLL